MDTYYVVLGSSEVVIGTLYARRQLQNSGVDVHKPIKQPSHRGLDPIVLRCEQVMYKQGCHEMWGCVATLLARVTQGGTGVLLTSQK
jgi:hypothetical protein